MVPDSLLLFGNVALRHGYLHRVELSECLGIQDRMSLIGGAKRIGEILVDQGYLDLPQVKYILRRQAALSPEEDELSRFGTLAQSNGFIDDTDIRRALRLQRKYEKKRGLRLHLGEIFLVQGSLSLPERNAILACQARVRNEDVADIVPPDAPPEELLLELERIDRGSRIRGALLVALLMALALLSIAALLAATMRH